VVLMTMLSTALQEYPDLRVVLLVDDPPNPRYAGPRKAARLRPTRCPPRSSACSRSRAAASTGRWRAFEMSIDPSLPTTAGQVHALAGEYEHAGSWIQSLSDQYHVSDHNEAFFATARAGQTGDRPRGDRPRPAHRRRLRAGEDRRPPGWPSSTRASPGPSAPRSRASSASASPRFSAEPNKAMNLNSYIGLMGGAYREVLTPAGLNLVAAGDQEPDLIVPESEYILTIDGRQRDHARVLPAPGPPAGAGAAPESRRRPVPLQRLSRRGDAARADRRRDHRPPAHHPPGDDLPRRHLLGRGQRDPPQRALAEIEEVEYQGPFKIYATSPTAR